MVTAPLVHLCVEERNRKKERIITELDIIDSPNLTSGTIRTAPSPAGLELQNRFSALLPGHRQNAISGKASELAKHEPHISKRRKWYGLVVVHFHL